MTEINYEIIGRKLKVFDPATFKELNDIPKLSDISVICQILEDISCLQFKSNFTKEYIYLAIILKLYEPDVLNGWKRGMAKNGLRPILSDYFACCTSNISNYIPRVRNCYLIYKVFKEEVDYIALEIGEKYAR